MNILMVANYPPDVGYAWWLMQYFWELIAQEVVSSGGAAYLAYPSIDDEPDFARENGIKVVELPFLVNHEDSLDKACKFIKANNIDSIYLTDRAYYDTRYRRLRRAGVRSITIHDHTPGDRAPIKGLRGVIKRLRNSYTSNTADWFINVSQHMTERSLLNGRIPAEKCLTVQNGIRPVEISKAVKFRIRSDLRIPHESLVMVTSGRLHPYKRVDFVLKAFNEVMIANQGRDIFLLVIGDGPAREELQSLASSSTSPDKIRFLGFCDNAREILQAADFAMHAAQGEGFSLSIVEYMSAQLPVIVPDIPSVCQAIDNDKNGIIYDYNSLSSAADGIRRFLDDDYRKTLAKNAKEKADNLYSLDECRRQFDAAFDNIVFGS